MAAVVLTLPQPRAAQAAAVLSEAGHHPIELPFARLVAQPAELARLAKADLRRYDHLIFVSPASVGFAASVLRGATVAPGTLCAVGTGSTAALLAAGLASREDEIVHPPGPLYDADALCALPPMAPDIVGRVMVLKGEGGRRDWIDRYREQGVEVDEFNLFGSEPVTPALDTVEQLRALCEQGASVVLVLSSRQALRGLLGWAPAAPLLDWLRRQPVAAVHPNVEAPCRAAGWERVSLPRAGQTLGELALELANGL